MCALIVLINTITFYYLRSQMKVLQKTGGRRVAQRISQMKKNTHFYIQGCISAAVVIIATILFRIVPLFNFKKFGLAIITGVNWELIAISNGLILLLFNKSLRNVKRNEHVVISVTNH
ncbi:unnamed protein product [Cylicostephanus goldi]|uniref:7TM GPCR serpentine receptor class x (Srx) domain-containing protein n=1 Tax=Cylicostephanus goldi TaxID=71465 RepID=A0A3P6T3R7_CYLGO|nr:unnamed protein product [Cylicostephanus goldi]